jgi:hypothetical protein
MPSWCGKQASKLRTYVRKTTGRLSTHCVKIMQRTTSARAKDLITHVLFTQQPTGISPAKKRISPLIEHYFYPVSTAPINYYTQLNFKER